MNTFLKALHLKKDEPQTVHYSSHNNLRPSDQYPTQNTYQNTAPNNYQNTMPYDSHNAYPNNFQNNYPNNYQNNIPSNAQGTYQQTFQNNIPNNYQNNYPNSYQNNMPNNHYPGTIQPSNQSSDISSLSRNSDPHTSHNTFHPTATHTTPNTAWHFQLPPTHDYDFLERDRLSEHHLKHYKAKIGSWGPNPPKFPHANVPSGVDPVAWKRHRVIEVAQRYVGLPYQHHHDPLWVSPTNGQGVDCSNFSSWVYNYALGIHFTSDCGKQANSQQSPGRRLEANEPLEVGDLLFLLKGDKSCISHVVIYMGNGMIIDSGKGGVCVRNHAGWYKSHHLFTRRVIE